MFVERIEDFGALEGLRGNWEELYAADPEAHFFLSWPWIGGRLHRDRGLWFVLAVKRNAADDRYVALACLRTLVRFEPGRGFHNELAFASPGFISYTGFLVHPDCEAEAVTALARHIRLHTDWARIHVSNLLMSERRRRAFMKEFAGPALRLEREPHVHDGTDNLICPYAELPPDWDEYLSDLSANNRQKIRRLLRRLEASAELSIAPAGPDTVEDDIEVFLEFWRARWELSKGDRTPELIAWMREQLTASARAETLFLPVFRHGGRPVAALAIVLDRVKETVLFLASGRDESYADMPAGYVLHAWCIRWAIGEGFRVYDFMHGNEAYKYHFAGRERRLTSMEVATRSNRNHSRTLDRRGCDSMLAQTLELETEGAFADAELGYRQILELAPDDPLALYRFGRFMMVKGEAEAARRLLERSLAADANGDNTLRWLIRALEALGDTPAALDACRRLLALRPKDKDATELMLRLGAASPSQRLPALAIPPVATALDPGWARRQLAKELPATP